MRVAKRSVTLAMTVVTAAAALGGCASNTTPKSASSAAPLSFVIRISDNVFTPSTLTVPHGTSVTWQWSGQNQHSVVGRFGTQDVNSPKHRGSGSLTLTMTDSGTWRYECGVHGTAMSGTIIVQ